MHRSIMNGAVRASVLAALAASAALVGPSRAAAPPRGGWQGGATDPRQEVRLRWWLDVWAHSMQEQCFIRWMDERTGGTEWKLAMPVRRVESTWAWWVVHVWPALEKPEDGK